MMLRQGLVDEHTVMFLTLASFLRQLPFDTGLLLFFFKGDISEAERKWKQQFNDWSTKYMVNWKAEFDNYVNGKQCEGKGY